MAALIGAAMVAALVQVQLAGPVPLAAAAALIVGVRLVALRRRRSALIPA